MFWEITKLRLTLSVGQAMKSTRGSGMIIMYPNVLALTTGRVHIDAVPILRLKPDLLNGDCC